MLADNHLDILIAVTQLGQQPMTL